MDVAPPRPLYVMRASAPATYTPPPAPPLPPEGASGPRREGNPPHRRRRPPWAARPWRHAAPLGGVPPPTDKRAHVVDGARP